MNAAATDKLDEVLSVSGLVVLRYGPRDTSLKFVAEMIVHELTRPCEPPLGHRKGVASICPYAVSSLDLVIDTAFKRHKLHGPVAEDTSFDTSTHQYNHWVILKKDKTVAKLERVVAHGLETDVRTKLIYMDDMIPLTKARLFDMVTFAKEKDVTLVALMNVADTGACAKEINRFAHTTIDLTYSDSLPAVAIRIADSTVTEQCSFILPFTNGVFDA